jgi:hypothetical protein
MKERMDVYTLAKQMGTSVKMIELHYGHLNPALKADVIAGKRYVKRDAEPVVKKSAKLRVVK